VDVARTEWERAFRQLESERDDARRYRNRLAALGAVTDELRSRIGQTFTLGELTRVYGDVERWGREVVSEHAEYEGWARDLSLVEDAAFYVYARGATDYDP